MMEKEYAKQNSIPAKIFALLAAVSLLFALVPALSLTAYAYEGDLTAAASPTEDLSADASPSEEPSAESSSETGSDTAEPVFQFHPGYRNTVMKLIKFPYLDTAEVAYEWAFPYSDSFFRYPSDQFSVPLARGSLGMAVSAFRSTKGTVSPQYETYLREAGFHRLYSFGYDKPTTQDSLSGIIGMKKIDDFTVIAVVTCGQGYEKEWAGNLIVGDNVRHDGFNYAATLLEQYIRDYIDRYGIEGNMKLWLNGMSRAAAVANITAADMIESGSFEDVYAYLYGVPRTTKEPVQYKGIYNICGQYDPVASVPLQSWGYERYGTDLYTPSQEADSEYEKMSLAASTVSGRMTGKPFRNNPEVNYQLRLITEFLGEFFPTSQDYSDRFQDILLETWQTPNADNINNILAESMMRIEAVSSKEETSKNVFIEYLSYIAGEHLRASQRQVETGGWAPDESLAANMVIEHRPSTYVKWMFSGVDPESLFFSSTSTRKLIFIGDVSVDVFRDGQYAGGIDEKGVLYQKTESGNDSSTEEPLLFMMRNGSQTTINLPDNDEYTLNVASKRTSELTYYDQLIRSSELKESPGTIHIGTIGEGICTMTVTPGSPIGTLTGKIAGYTDILSSDFECLPSVIMANELKATRYSFLTLRSMLKIVSYLMFIVFNIIFISLIVNVYHLIKVKKGHAPYSDMYVIIPHLLLIAIFMLQTQFLTYFLFTIGKARAISATVTILLIFLLSLSGFIRHRNLRNAVITVVMLALVPFVNNYYLSLPIDTFSYTNMTIYFVITISLTAAALSTFRSEKARGSVKSQEPALP